MKQYTITIETAKGTLVASTVYATDRADAIAFVKRNNQARFFRKEYKRIKGARALSGDITGFMVRGPDHSLVVETETLLGREKASESDAEGFPPECDD